MKRYTTIVAFLIAAALIMAFPAPAHSQLNLPDSFPASQFDTTKKDLLIVSFQPNSVTKKKLHRGWYSVTWLNDNGYNISDCDVEWIFIKKTRTGKRLKNRHYL